MMKFTLGEKILMVLCVCQFAAIVILSTKMNFLKDECEKDLLRSQVCVMSYVLKEGD